MKNPTPHEEKIDEKITEYLQRANLILREFNDEDSWDTNIIEIAKMIQRETHHRCNSHDEQE